MSKDEDQIFEHESYGMVGFSRISGNPGRLFGSALSGQNTYIRLQIKQAVRTHSLGRDWYRGRAEPIIEINLSSSQFAELLTSMNVGDGVPCTICYANGKQMERPPNEKLESEQIRHDFKGKIAHAYEKLNGFADNIRSIINKKNIGIKDRDDVKMALNLMLQEVGSNLPFWLKSFEEATEKMTVAAKAEVDSFMTHAIMLAGIKALISKNDIDAPSLPEST